MKRAFQTAAVVLVVVEVLWGCLVIYGVSDGAWSFPDELVFFYGGIAFGVIGVIWFATAVVRALRARDCSLLRRLLSRNVLFQPIFLGTVFLLASYGLAFRARFELSRPALERYAIAITDEQLLHSEAKWIGALRIKEVDRAGDSIRFITGACFFDDCGVAYSPSGAEPLRVGEDRYKRISATWWYWRRSW